MSSGEIVLSKLVNIKNMSYVNIIFDQYYFTIPIGNNHILYYHFDFGK